MDWLESYRDLIFEREKFKVSDIASMVDELRVKFDEIFEPLADGSLDPGDLERIRDAWWRHFGKEIIDREKHAISLHLKLIDLYKRLENASDVEWNAYARMVLDALFSENSLMRQVLEMRAASEKIMKDSPDVVGASGAIDHNTGDFDQDQVKLKPS